MTSTTDAPPAPGLSAAEVATRVAAGEVNAHEEVTSRPLSEIVRANVFTRFNALLGTLFALVLATGRWLDGLFGIAAILNTAFGIAQEWSAKRKLDSLAVLTAPTVRVVRDGLTSEIPVAEVVRGDLVEVRAGDQVPADGPVVAAHGLEVDESNLTGESDSVAKHTGDPMASGTAVVAGRGWFTADVVGEATQANRLSAQAKEFTRAYSDVQASTNRLLRYLTWVLVVSTPLILWSQWRAVGDKGWQEVVVRVASALNGLLPEGLVLLTTMAFVLAAVQLARRQALIQELPAVEGLARVDVICLDKTGTLTLGEIAFERIIALPYAAPAGTPAASDTEAYAARVLGALARTPNANATSKAIAAAVPDPGWSTGEEVPFTSARKWSAAEVHEGPDGQAPTSYWVLGAPDVLLPSCPPDTREDLEARLAPLADEGSRVVLLARAPSLPTRHTLPDLAPVALVVLGERTRPDAAETLRFFADQGVAVKVISGDNPRTVGAVARRVGVDVGEPLDARTLPEDPAALAPIAESTTVFGRVSPGQKRALVKALQANGHTVAMTGDGVNDVLALKDADVGIAMGNGAPATKAVAQMVLLDGRYANLPKILAEGRRLIANVERVANLFVTKNVMSATAILGTALLLIPFPILPRQLTIVATFTIGIPGAALALGPNHRRYEPGFLRRVLALSIPAGVAGGVVSFLAYWFTARLVGLGAGDEIPGTAAVVALLIVNFWLLGVLARPYRWWKVGLIVTMIVAVVVLFATELGRRTFLFHASWPELVPALLLGLAGALVVEIAYRFSRHLHT